MGVSNVHLLLSIIFLYFAANGIAATVITHHIAKHGGNHVILGSLVTCINISALISKDFVALFERSKKSSLNFCLWSALFTFYVITVSSAWYVSYFARVFLALTVQVVSTSKEIVMKNEPPETQITTCNLMDSMRVAGLSVGCITGGYIYTCTKKFSTNCAVSCGITIGALLLAARLDNDFTTDNPKNFFKIPDRCITRIKNLRGVNYKAHLDVIMLKLLYVATINIFYSRYTFIAGYNYRIKSIAVGYLKSYNYLLIYFTNLIAPFVLEKIHKRDLCEYCMLFCTVTLVGLNYAPHIRCFLFFFIFVMFFYSLVNLLLQQDALRLRQDKRLDEAVDTIVVIVKIIEPFMYGIILYFFGGEVYKISMLLPAVLYTFILHMKFGWPKKQRWRDFDEDDSFSSFSKQTSEFSKNVIEEDEEDEDGEEEDEDEDEGKEEEDKKEPVVDATRTKT